LLIAALIWAWGAFALISRPWWPFPENNIAQAVVGAAAFAYFAATRSRPRQIVADAFSASAIAYSLFLVPWTAVVWAGLGRPWEALTVPQVGILTMALVAPPQLWAGLSLVAAFAVETGFVYFRARHLRQAMPFTEPYFTLMLATLGVYVVWLRRRRRQLVQGQIRLHAESEALGRLEPLFASLRDELDGSLQVIGDGLPTLQSHHDGVARSLQRISEVRDRIDPLVEPAPERDAAMALAETAFVASDAQSGAAAFGAMCASLGIFFVTLATHERFPRPLVALMIVVALSCLGYVLMVRGTTPSKSRSTIFVLLLWATLLSIATYGEWLLATHAIASGRPFTPFIPHKLLLVTLPLVAPALPRLTPLALFITVVDAVLLFFLLHLPAHVEVVSISEPWSTLGFGIIGFLLMGLYEQRLVASLGLLRAQSRRLALGRRARLLLALRDQLNSPLQALVLHANQAARHSPACDPALAREVARLVAMSRRLANLDDVVPLELSFDAPETLRHA
jgi:hypothetical protein